MRPKQITGRLRPAWETYKYQASRYIAKTMSQLKKKKNRRFISNFISSVSSEKPCVFQSITQHRNKVQKQNRSVLEFFLLLLLFSTGFDLDHGRSPVGKQERAASVHIPAVPAFAAPVKTMSCGMRTELRPSSELCCQVPRFASSSHSLPCSLSIKALEGRGQTPGAQSALCPALYWANWAWCHTRSWEVGSRGLGV